MKNITKITLLLGYCLWISTLGLSLRSKIKIDNNVGKVDQENREDVADYLDIKIKGIAVNINIGKGEELKNTNRYTLQQIMTNENYHQHSSLLILLETGDCLQLHQRNYINERQIKEIAVEVKFSKCDYYFDSAIKFTPNTSISTNKIVQMILPYIFEDPIRIRPKIPKKDTNIVKQEKNDLTKLLFCERKDNHKNHYSYFYKDIVFFQDEDDYINTNIHLNKRKLNCHVFIIIVYNIIQKKINKPKIQISFK